MNIILQLIAVIILAFLCGAVLTYPVYEIARLVTDIQFNKLITHITTLCAFLFIFVLLWLNNSLDRDTVGYRSTRSDIRKNVFTGLLWGLCIMMVLESMLFGIGIHIPEPELVPGLAFFMVLTFKAILSGVMVALIEESLYRGALLGILLRKTGLFMAILVSSTVYAAVHFISFPELTSDTNISITTGLSQLPLAFNRFLDPSIYDAFLSLTAFGVLLALIRIRNGNIYQCIGVHAGVVIGIKYIKELTDYNRDNPAHFLVSQYDHLLGILALIWLGLLVAVYYFLFRNYRKMPQK